MMWIVALFSCFVVIYARAPLNHGVYNERLAERVVGGVDALPNTWTWQVSLQYDSSNYNEYYHICGGSIIDSSYVMTAAHCILSPDPRHYRVVTGEYNLFEYDGSEQFSYVDKLIVHPGWTGDLGNGNDIALLRLVNPVYDNGFVKLAELPAIDQVLPHNFACYITGWGLLATGGSVPAILQEATIPVVEHAVCSTHAWWGDLAKKTMLWAGGDGRTAGCQLLISLPLKIPPLNSDTPDNSIPTACWVNSGPKGDSGGPLSCFTDGAWRVHGVVSYGPSGNCNMVSKPTVFTRVSSFMNWMYSCRNGSELSARRVIRCTEL
ncbi:hypothetical protein AAFF_G00002930 [Aldrovandia affinis]|uniref:Peptidase S1 domain-containing protein n=1 Tax=Aldrovandia affinis TaxID=143900 RepID=A0AAD7TD70_9TELE|nr:hypothetical protein AAFF_G00002930 [Aldrovandia affinis]